MGTCALAADGTTGADVPTPQEACAIVDAIMSHYASGPNWRTQSLAEVDCVAAHLRRGGRIPIKALLVLGKETQPLLRPRKKCGRRFVVHREINDGINEYIEIRLAPLSDKSFRFHAALTIYGKQKGKITGIGGTGCGAIRFGVIEWVDGSWQVVRKPDAPPLLPPIGGPTSR
jgi:hypothetical protein